VIARARGRDRWTLDEDSTRDAGQRSRARDADEDEPTTTTNAMSVGGDKLSRATNQRLTRSEMPLMLFYCTEVRRGVAWRSFDASTAIDGRTGAHAR